MNTRETRVKIGFPKDKSDWTKNPAVYDQHALRIAGHPVMEDWETSYMNELAAIATSNGGRVLELGYGMGLSASAIQSHDISEHTIIECHPDVVKKATRDFKEPISNGRMVILEGFWEDITRTLPNESFDGILFDTYPLTEEEIHSNHFWFFAEAYRLLKPNGILTYYSDEATQFSNEHKNKLTKAGFKAPQIKFKICNVSPPPDCEYWQSNTIIAPIIRK